jgi:hypothetical protein
MPITNHGFIFLKKVQLYTSSLQDYPTRFVPIKIIVATPFRYTNPIEMTDEAE